LVSAHDRHLGFRNESPHSVSRILLTRKQAKHQHRILRFVDEVSGRNDGSFIRSTQANGTVGVSISPCASPIMMSFGTLINAAPGRPDSAARKAFASTSEMELAESISAVNFVTGRKRLTVSML
jgi:hypothetical protein